VLAFQLSSLTCGDGIVWLEMVRRRSTVRFRKKAPRSRAVFEHKTEYLRTLSVI
jgi:hypothetical protein